jgi:hypothetical protein
MAIGIPCPRPGLISIRRPVRPGDCKKQRPQKGRHAQRQTPPPCQRKQALPMSSRAVLPHERPPILAVGREGSITHLCVAILGRPSMRRLSARVRSPAPRSIGVVLGGGGGGRALLVVRRVKVRARCGLCRALQTRQRVQRREHRLCCTVDGVRRRGGGASRAEERVRVAAARIRGALGTRHGHLVQQLGVVRGAVVGAGVLGSSGARDAVGLWLALLGRRCALAVGAFAAQRLVGGRRGRAAAAVAVVDAVFLMLLQLLEQEHALQTHLLDAAVQPLNAHPRAIVVLFNVVDSAPQVDAFSVVCRLDGRGEVLLRVGSRCCGH